MLFLHSGYVSGSLDSHGPLADLWISRARLLEYGVQRGLYPGARQALEVLDSERTVQAGFWMGGVE